MADENVRMTPGDFARWLLFVALLLGCVVAFFLLQARVAPAIHTAPTTVSP